MPAPAAYSSSAISSSDGTPTSRGGAGACVWLGYAFAASLHKIEKYATWAPIPLVILVVGGWIFVDIRRKRRERAEALEMAEVM